MKFAYGLILSLLTVAVVSAQQRPSYEGLVGNVPINEVNQSPEVQVPFIFWGADVITFVANGGLTTTPNSEFARQGLKIRLVPGDDAKQQVRDYKMGKSPFLRMTDMMAYMASETVARDPRTKPTMFLQLSWSLGDHLVYKEPDANLRQTPQGIEVLRPTQLQDWKGRPKKVRVALQAEGPHVGLLDDSLKSAGMTWDDIEPVWCKDLTGTDESPAEKLRKGLADAACVITPDMIGLTSGLDAVGSGAEKTAKGARVINSTSVMDKSIGDFYLCRTDWFNSHQDWVKKFNVGWLKTAEQVMKWKEAYANGKGRSPEYVAALKLAQTIYGKDKDGNLLLPTIEEDAHGLVSDANIVRIPGNEIYFNDPNNRVGFAGKQDSDLDAAIKLGYIRTKLGFNKASWDYRDISQLVGVNYVAPVYAAGRVRAEVKDFGDDLDSNTVLSFEINFEPEQTDFPIETYREKFQHFYETGAKFSRAAYVVEAHADPTLALQHFFWAAQAKGLITGAAPNYRFKGQPLELTNTDAIITAIQGENLAGQKRKNREGVLEEIPDPKTTVGAALQLSEDRGKAVKAALAQFGKEAKFQIDLNQIVLNPVGIADPVNPRPRNLDQAKQNMRVVFRVVRVKAEAVKDTDFNFDQP